MTVTLYKTLISSLCFITALLWIDTARATEISPIIGAGQENFSFELSEFTDEGRKVQYEPNIAGIFRIGLSAYGFGIGYSIRGTSQDVDPTKGKTTFTDFQLGYHNKKWGVDGYYQNYTGFYTKNTAVTQVFSNLSFQHYGVLGRLALNESDFSINAVTQQSDHIKESSTKYYLVTGFSQHIMETDLSLLQGENAGLNTELENLRKMKASTLKLGLGAGRIWYFENRLFFSGLLDLVPTYTYYTYTDNSDTKTNKDNLSLSYNLKLGLGYAGAKYKTGLGIGIDSTTLKTNSRGFFTASANRILIYVRAFYDF